MSTQEYPLKHCHRDSPWLGSEVSKDGVCPTLNEAVSSQLLVHGRIAIAGTKRLHGLSGSKVECWSGAGASNSGRLSAWDLKITFPHSHHTESHWMGAAAVVCMCVWGGFSSSSISQNRWVVDNLFFMNGQHKDANLHVVHNNLL